MKTFSSLQTFVYAALLSTTAVWAAPSRAAKQAFSWDAIKYVYAFGDSYSFVQGTEGHANYSFIGDAFNVSFTPEQLLSDRIIPQNTSSDGSNWLEFLTGCGSGLPSSCTPRQLWDFAFAGADIDAALLPLHHNYSVDLVTQVQQFALYASDVISHPIGETLTAWFIGINDTGDSLKNTTISNFTAFWEEEMTSYFNAVEVAWDHGLQGAHLFLNVPPEQRAPGQLDDYPWNNTLEEHILEYNSILATYISKFASAHPEAEVFTYDSYSWFNTWLDNPAKYGFSDITGYCTCTNDSYFWYNTGHPTQAVHKLIASTLTEQLQNASTA